MVQFLIILVMLGSLIGLLSGWRRDRKLLSEARKGSQDRALSGQLHSKRPMTI